MEQLAETYVDKELLSAYNKGFKEVITKYESRLREFLASENKNVLFENIDKFQRKMIHRLCERYHLEERETKLKLQDKADLCIKKTISNQQLPKKTVIEIIESKKEVTEYKIQDKKPKKVLTRNKNTESQAKKSNIIQSVINSPPTQQIAKHQSEQKDNSQQEKQEYNDRTDNNSKSILQNHYEYDPDYDRQQPLNQYYGVNMQDPRLMYQYQMYQLNFIPVPAPFGYPPMPVWQDPKYLQKRKYNNNNNNNRLFKKSYNCQLQRKQQQVNEYKKRFEYNENDFPDL